MFAKGRRPNLIDADTGRESYFEKLSKYLGIASYKDEKSMDVFSVIHSPERIKAALRNAEKLDRIFCNESSYAKTVPCTQVFILIRALEKRLRISFTDIEN